MPQTPLPFAPEELARRLSRSLAPRPDGLELSVTEAVLADVPGDPGYELRMRVTATTVTDPDGEVWQVNLPLGPEDFLPDIDPISFVVTIRANIEEWWDVKDAEPDFAA